MKREKQTTNKIKNKLLINKAIITKADKGNSITYQENYHNKIQNFIVDNNFATINNDPAKIFQKVLRSLVNECQTLIRKKEKWKYINLNPSAPTISGLLKIHKFDSPIRPVVNWKQAPAYKIAKILSKNSNNTSHSRTYST